MKDEYKIILLVIAFVVIFGSMLWDLIDTTIGLTETYNIEVTKITNDIYNHSEYSLPDMIIMATYECEQTNLSGNWVKQCTSDVISNIKQMREHQ